MNGIRHLKIKKFNFLGKSFNFKCDNLGGIIEKNFVSDSLFPFESSMNFIEAMPTNFTGRFFSYKDLYLFQNHKNNYFYLKDKSNIDYELTLTTWIRYNISYSLSKRFINIHAALVEYKGKKYIFVGESKSGKTSIAYLFHKKGARVYTDEYVLMNENEVSFIPRPLFVNSRWDKKEASFYSNIIGEKVFKIDSIKKMEVLDNNVEIFFLCKRKRLRTEAFLNSIHNFGFYSKDYFKRGFYLWDLYEKKSDVFVWKKIGELKDFVDGF